MKPFPLLLLALLPAIGATARTTAPVPPPPLIARWQTAAPAGRPFGLYQDVARTTPALKAGDRVQAFHDENRPGGLTLAQPDPAKAPVLQFSAGRPVLRFDGIDDHLLLAAPVSLDALDLWVRYTLTRPPTSAYDALVSGRIAGGYDFGPANAFRLQVIDYQRSTGQNIPQVTHLSARAGAVSLFVNGALLHQGKFATGDVTELSIGSALPRGPKHYLAMDLEAVVLARDVPPAAFPAIDASLDARLDTPRLVCIGDSLTDGSNGYGKNSIAATLEYPSQLQLLRPGRFVINAGKWGALVSTLAPVDPLCTPGAQLVVFIGSNNLSGGQSPDEAYKAISAYCRARQAKGWTVYVTTLLPRVAPKTVPDWETKRQATNELIRQNHAAFSDGLIDFAADPRVGEAGDELDATHYTPDQIHLTAAGAAVLAALVHRALPPR